MDVVRETAERAGSCEVRSIYLTIGEVRDVVTELFEGAIRYLARGTAAQGANVFIERPSYTVHCRTCGLVYPADVHDDASHVCPHCGIQNCLPFAGMEFHIDRIEVA